MDKLLKNINYVIIGMLLVLLLLDIYLLLIGSILYLIVIIFHLGGVGVIIIEAKRNKTYFKYYAMCLGAALVIQLLDILIKFL